MTSTAHSRTRKALVLTSVSLALMAAMAPAAAVAQDIPKQEINQALHDSLPDAIKQSGKVIAAGSFDNPPAIYADVNDAAKALGLAPDLATSIGEILGVTFEWQNTQWPGQLPGLDAGTFDVLWGQISVTAQREREVIDLIPWSQDGLGFLVTKGNPAGLQDWASSCGKKVGISIGSIFVGVLKNASDKYCTGAGQPAIEISEFQGNEEPALRSGQIDAVLDNHSVMAKMAANLSDVYEAVAIPQDQSFEFYPGLTGVGVKKTNAALATAIAEALKTLYENGTWTLIAEHNDASATIPDEALVKVNALTGTPAGEFVKQ